MIIQKWLTFLLDHPVYKRRIGYNNPEKVVIGWS